MDIDVDTLNIPDTDYDARVTMPSAEFGRIVRDLSLLGESVRIEVSKEGVRFISDGEAANGNILLRDTQASSRGKGSSSKDDEPEEEDEPEDEDEDEDKPKKKKIKKEKVKKEDGEDVEMNGDAEEDEEQEFKPKDGDDDEDDAEEEEEGEKSSKKRKKAPAKVRCAASFSTSVCTNTDVERKACEEGKERRRRRAAGGRAGGDERARQPDVQSQVSRQLLKEQLAVERGAAHDEQRRAPPRESHRPARVLRF